MGKNGRVVLLIPALNPEERLLELLARMRDCWQWEVVLVDDGSDAPAKENIFAKAEALGAVVLTHACNQGKGRALKTGFNECLNRWEDLLGVVTADADGQHTPQDICACADALRAHPDSLILGCRDFSSKDVPARSSFGNRLTRNVMKFLCGVSVTDTQTGLRGIPADFMRALLTVGGERFEFETNMLLETRFREVPIVEVPISTVYLEQNRASHFNPLTDSLKIYALFGKFIAASLAGFVVDILLFSLFCSLEEMAGGGGQIWEIPLATVLARVCSALVNFLLNRSMVFQSKKKGSGCMARYAALCVVQMLASAGLVTFFASLVPVPAVAVKVVVDLLLFLCSFQIQRRWVF